MKDGYLHYLYSFPDDSQSGDSDLTNCSKWRELTVGSWFEVADVMAVKTQFGESFILTLISRDGISRRYWSTKMIGSEVGIRMTANTDGKKLYVKSLGKKPNTQKTKEYFDFDIMCN